MTSSPKARIGHKTTILTYLLPFWDPFSYEGERFSQTPVVLHLRRGSTAIYKIGMRAEMIPVFIHYSPNKSSGTAPLFPHQLVQLPILLQAKKLCLFAFGHIRNHIIKHHILPVLLVSLVIPASHSILTFDLSSSQWSLLTIATITAPQPLPRTIRIISRIKKIRILLPWQIQLIYEFLLEWWHHSK